MGKLNRTNPENSSKLPKAPTGIKGLDEITLGGLPLGRPTLLCGGAGCGKTMMALEFLVNGARLYGEPGVFMSFEETAGELTANAASLHFDLPELEAKGLVSLDHVQILRNELEETGEYNLEGLFIRLAHAIDSIGAKRVVLDTIESLFSVFSNEAIIRAELRRLFGWLKTKGITAVITGERGDGRLTRQGLEEYVADCVILLDHRVNEQISTRRLRIVKYRGSTHYTNEYPFLIGETGISVLPITSLGLTGPASEEIISSGVPELDRMLGVGGYYRGSSVLLSGTAGTGKTTLAASVCQSACQRGERCLYVSFEESPAQLTRNLRSVGIDLQSPARRGLLKIISTRPFAFGLEMHLLTLHKEIDSFQPSVVVIDPISSLTSVTTGKDARAMVTRLIDYIKNQRITLLVTHLMHGGSPLEQTESEISSLIDSWLIVRDVEMSGERNRVLYLLKSRGMPHSNQIREFVLSKNGVSLLTPYLGPAGVLTGSARVSQEAQEREAALARGQEVDRNEALIRRKRRAMEAQIAALRAEFEAEHIEIGETITRDTDREKRLAADRSEMARSRKSETVASDGRARKANAAARAQKNGPARTSR